MLKSILPKYFKEEYLTLKQIDAKKENVDQIFESAQKTSSERLAKIQQVGESLQKFKKELEPAAIESAIAEVFQGKPVTSSIEEDKLQRDTI